MRDAAGSDALSDPAPINEKLLHRLMAADAVVVSDEAGMIAGFAVVDGDRIHLLVDATQRSKGIGRDLLAWACEAVGTAGHVAATLVLAPASRAERHYRAAGWTEAGRSAAGGAILEKRC
ncbi:MAG TPA: GNAT family N-acetyltransferase [Stellaceae bacterium]|nr:GNAT family N-acetyltransferase [Stellaceae bacterium]